MNKLLVSFFLLFSYFLTSGQEKESIVFHLNKSFYAEGEEVLYRIHLPKSLENHRYFHLNVSNDERVLEQVWLEQEGSGLSGFYKIPYDQPPVTCSSRFLHFKRMNKY